MREEPMYYTLALSKAIEYIEDNLVDEISVEKLTWDIGYSRHHFSRLFHAFTGYTIIGYIRLRKLNEVARELIETDIRILDLAIKYGFKSQESFARAFKEVLGVTPVKHRASKKYKSILEPLKVENVVLVREGIEVKPVIKYITSKKFIGLVYKGFNQKNEIADLWKGFFGRLGEIKERREDGLYYGLCEPIVEDIEMVNLDNVGEIAYMVGIEVSEALTIPDGMEVWEITNQKYAVFTHIGDAESIRETYKLIYSKWLPESGYQAGYTYDFELYDDNFGPTDSNSKMYVYIPVQ